MLCNCFPLVAAFVETETKNYMRNRTYVLSQIKDEYRYLYSLVGDKANYHLKDLCSKYRIALGELSDMDMLYVMGEHYYD